MAAARVRPKLDRRGREEKGRKVEENRVMVVDRRREKRV